MTPLWYTLIHRLSQIQTSIFLGIGQSPVASKDNIQSYSYCSTIKALLLLVQIQDGHKLWVENSFYVKLQLDQAPSGIISKMAAKSVINFVEISLFCTVSEINGFLPLAQIQDG